jgi:hypothetical protein
MYKLNSSFKHHTYVGVFISLWIFIFTFYIRPFDGASFDDLYWWRFLSIGFSLITFLSYFITIIFQNSLYIKTFNWNIGFEIFILLFFHFLNLIFTYLYYKSPFLYGILTFTEYSNAFLKSAIIFTPIIIFARRFILKLIPNKKIVEYKIDYKKEEFLTIKGDYKLDFLKISKPDLVCISKSQNYIEVFFMESGYIKSKLMRSSLKKVQVNLVFLVQVHRSHLINPLHFKSWKNQNVIFLTQKEIPVSKNYKNNLLSL